MRSLIAFALVGTATLFLACAATDSGDARDGGDRDAAPAPVAASDAAPGDSGASVDGPLDSSASQETTNDASTALPLPCADGTSVPSPDGCNTCVCADGSGWACTKKACIKDAGMSTCPPPRQDQGACAAVVGYAKNPANGQCCTYGTACTAPAGWQIFYSASDCNPM